MTLVTIPNVPILETGTFDLSTGPATFTEEDLAAALAALQDPAVKDPRIKIDGLAKSFDPMAHGGEPAFGRVEAMHLSEDGQTIIGDLLVPDWLGDCIEWAYPARSIEGGWGWTSPTGKQHQFVITALALLGVDLPGVTTLEDLPDLLSGAGLPSNMPTKVVARMPASTVRAGINQDLIRQRYYEALEAGDAELPEGASTWSLWIRSMRFDDSGTPYLKVTDEETGRLYRVDFSISGNAVSFTGHQEVVETDVPVTAGARRPRPAIATWATKADSRPHTDKEDRMDPAEIRRSLGLAEDATDEQVAQAFARARGEAPEGEQEQPPADADKTPAEQEAPAEQEREPVAASSGTVTLDQAAYEQLRSDAAAGREAREVQLRSDRDAIVEEAIASGRIPPARRDHWRRALDADQEGVAASLKSLEPGLIPVSAELGVGASPEEGSQELPNFNHLFPQLTAKEA